VRFYKRTEQWDGGTDKGGDAAPVLLATVTTPPYEWTWHAVPYTDPSGSGVAIHWISMEAVDDSGEIVSTGEMSLNVWRDAQASTAQVKFLAPDPDRTPVFQAPASIVLVASGSFVGNIEWFANGVSIGSTPAPNGANGEFVLPWRNVAAGVYAITVRFVDGFGRVGTATAAPLTVNVGLPTPPTVTLTTPTSVTVVPRDQSNTASASVTSLPASPWNYVEFTETYRFVALDYDAPFSATYAAAPGIHMVQAQAYQQSLPAGEPARAWIVAPVTARSPVGVMTSPSPTGSYTTTTPITLTVDAKARDGSIGSVDFYSGGNVIKTLTSRPYTYTTQFPSGTQSVYAGINVLFGPRAFTTPVSFSVAGPNAGISIAITSPTNGQNVVVPNALPLTVAVTDPNHNVTQVTYTWTANVNGGQVAASSTPPYSAIWNLSGLWQYVLVATAWTPSGTVSSQPVIFNGVPNEPPTVSIMSPTSGQRFFAGQPIPITASATDPDGAVAKVDYYTASGTLLGTSTNAPFTFNWAPLSAGTYAIYAVATDDHGATTQSTTVTGIMVDVNAIPAVSLMSPQTGSSFAAGATINLAAAAMDGDGTIARVDFYAGPMLLGSATAVPYLFAWNNVAVGSYVLTARAVDNRGAVTTSAPVSVNVQTLGLAITSPAANAQIAADFVTITGTYQAPLNSGVTINGVVAHNDGQGNFYINNFPLAAGTNTFTVKLASPDGAATSLTQAVTSTGIAPFQISLDPDTGMAQTTATIRVAQRGAAGWSNIAFSGIGTGVLDTTGLTQTVPGTITYAVPGIYKPRVTLTDAAGNAYTQTLSIIVQDKTAQGQSMQAVWTRFAGALAGGDKKVALASLNAMAQVRYGPVFDALESHLREIVANWSAPRIGRMSDEVAELTVARNIDGVKRLFFIYLLRDGNGIWRVENM
jgi:hypothetical protein